MQQKTIVSLSIGIVAVLVACIGIYVSWRITQGKMEFMCQHEKCLLTVNVGPFRRRQHRHAPQFPAHNYFRRRVGIMFIDETLGRDYPNNWLPFATNTEARRLAGEHNYSLDE